MPEAWNPGGDFPEVVDRTETITLLRAGDGAAVSVVSALRRGVSLRDAAHSGGRLLAADVRWHLSVAELTDPPALGDRIRDVAGDQWTVLEVRHETAGSRWVVNARDLAVVHGLLERIDIERAIWTKDAAGAARPVWRPHRAGLRARIQPSEARLRASEGRSHFEATHRVLFAEPLDFSQDDRVVGADGRTYRIIAYRPAVALGDAHELDVIAGATFDQSPQPAASSTP